MVYDIIIIIIIILILQVPYNTNNIFILNVFFSGNVISDVFSIKRYILFILAINSFLKNTELDINNIFTFIDDY